MITFVIIGLSICLLLAMVEISKLMRKIQEINHNLTLYRNLLPKNIYDEIKKEINK